MWGSLVLGSIRQRLHSSKGFTAVEMIIIVVVTGLLVAPVIGGMFFFYGGTVANSMQAQLGVEAQNILRSMTEELRVSSGVRANNTISDANAPGGGWTTSNENLVLIISTPALDSDNNFILNTTTGNPYHNEIIYFADDDTLYKRYLAHPDAAGNTTKTSCPAALATASCPADVKMSENFKTMNFVFYDQDNALTSVLTNARSIKMTVSMEKKAFGRTIDFDNNIRVTIRNSSAL